MTREEHTMWMLDQRERRQTRMKLLTAAALGFAGAMFLVLAWLRVAAS